MSFGFEKCSWNGFMSQVVGVSFMSQIFSLSLYEKIFEVLSLDGVFCKSVCVSDFFSISVPRLC